MKTTKRLREHHWDTISEHASIYRGGFDLDSENDGNAESDDGMNPHALIELDWYVFIYFIMIAAYAQHLDGLGYYSHNRLCR